MRGKAIEVVGKPEDKVWDRVRGLTRKVSRYDEIGFFTTRGEKIQHWVLRKGEFTNENQK